MIGSKSRSDNDYDDFYIYSREVQVYPDEEHEVDTGLLDQYGEPIFRYKERVKIGFQKTRG